MSKDAIAATDISGLESTIRDLINKPHRRTVLFENEGNWNQLCGALDAIGDAEMGIAAFEAMQDPGEPGARYVAVYGLLQLLYVEQDAVEALVRLFDLKLDRPVEVSDVRQIRNRSIGHPVQTRDGASHFISRIALSLAQFSLMSRWPDGRTQFATFKTCDLITQQRAALGKTLRAVATHLEEDEMAHREKFQSRKLEAIFQGPLFYSASKIEEGTRARTEPGLAKELAKACVIDVREAVKKFISLLRERGVDTSATSYASEVIYPLDELEQFFSGESSRLSERDASIFADYVTNRLKDLRKMAADIDKEYADTEPSEVALPGG